MSDWFSILIDTFRLLAYVLITCSKETGLNEKSKYTCWIIIIDNLIS